MISAVGHLQRSSHCCRVAPKPLELGAGFLQLLQLHPRTDTRYHCLISPWT